MGISPTDLERALASVNELALPALAAIFLYQMLCRGVRSLVSAPATPGTRPDTGPSRPVRRGLSVLGLLIGAGSPAAAAERPLPRRTPAYSVDISSLRSEPGGFPPPRLPGPAEPPAGSPVTTVPSWTDPERRTVHPAVHRGGSLSGARLFRRWNEDTRSATPGRSAAPQRERWHAVLPGETLWSIAAARLETDDIRRIARYWPRIHRANREEIGPNPDLIRPGQVLELPPERA